MRRKSTHSHARRANYFEVRETEPVVEESAKAYKRNIRAKSSAGYRVAYLALLLKTVAREIAAPFYGNGMLYNADGTKRRDGWNDDGPKQVSLDAPRQSDKGASERGGMRLVNGREEGFEDKVSRVASDILEDIKKIRHHGESYFIMAHLDNDYDGLMGKSVHYDVTKKLKTAMVENVEFNRLDMEGRREVAKRIQAYFEDDWAEQAENQEFMRKFDEKRRSPRNMTSSPA